MAQIDVNLRDLYRVVRKRKWIILFAAILMSISTYTMTDIPVPVYTAEARVRISRSSTVAGLMTDMVQYSAYDNMATQVMVISSRPVLEDVALRLNLVKPNEDTQSIYDDLRGRVSAEQVGSSDILAIRGTAGDSAAAIALANTLVDAYIDKYRKDRDQKMEETVSYLRRRSDEIKTELDDNQKKLFDFKRQEGSTLALNPNRGLELQQKHLELQQKLDALNSNLSLILEIQNNKDYDGLLASYMAFDDSIANQIYNKTIGVAQAWSGLRVQREGLLGYQTKTNPAVKSVENQMDAESAKIQPQLNQLAAQVRKNLAVLKDQQDGIGKELSMVGRQPELATQLDELTIGVVEMKEASNEVRKRLGDADIQQREKVEEISVVERAHTASTVPQPARRNRAFIGALIGLLIGGVFSFVLEAMDTSLGTIEDVEQHISSVVLGIIPHLEKEDVKDRMKLDRGPALSSEEVDRFARLVTHFDTKSIGSEAYRTLRTNVVSIMGKTEGKVILVSSSMIQEGKTTSCTNLAVAFAQGGKRVLLIDADLRRPSVDKTFGIVRVPGLTDLLLDTRDARECYRTIDDVMLGKFGLKLAQATPGLEYLTILPAGRIVDKPTELLTAPALDKLIAEVRNKFDVILVDVSPILPVADAFVLAPKVDGVILAYQIGRVARDVLKRTKMRIESVGGKVWGVILNDIQSEIDYRSGDFSYYHYRYDRQVDEPKTLAQKIKAAFTGGASASAKPARKAQKPRARPPEPPPPPPQGPVASGGTGSPSASQEVKDIMSLTDDN